MQRRVFLRRAAMGAAGWALGGPAWGWTESSQPGWRTFEVTTEMEVLRPVGVTRVWVPRPLATPTTFQRTLASTVHCDGGRATAFEDAAQGLLGLRAEFPAGVRPKLTVRDVVSTRDWSVPLAAPEASLGRVRRVSVAEQQRFLQPTRYVPTDGIVRQRATEITRGASTDVDKTRAVYEWVVENTRRDAAVRGCGVGDIRPMLERGALSGKCADLNALYVGLVRAAGVPARDVYGLRVGPSAMGYRSLGMATQTVTKAQHCRAEVYLQAHGWVPVDPADVRKVVLEEQPGGLALTDPKVQAARARLFGAWEMNWMAYSYAQDVALPGSDRGPLHFFMYPQAETAEGRLDALDPETFQYGITSREVPAAG